MSGERRIQIIGNIPLPNSLAEAGKLQVRVGEAVERFAKELSDAGIPGDMTCKVVSARPSKKEVAIAAQAPLPPVQNGGEITSISSDNDPGVGTVSAPTPPWART